MSLTLIIERIARHKALRYINHAFMAALLISCLLAVRETVNVFMGGRGQGQMSTGDASGKAELLGRAEARKARALSDYAAAVENNVFGIEGQKLTTITQQQLDSSAPVQVAPTVTIKLLGTVAWSDATGYAFVIESGTEQKMYKNGQDIPGAGVLSEVYPDMVVMDFNGNSYEVALESFTDEPRQRVPGRGARDSRSQGRAQQNGRDFSQFARRTGENEYVVNKRAIDESIQNPQNVLTDARLLPNMVAGAQKGFRILEIKPGGLYETLGLLNGDVLLAVNNFRLSSPESALQAFTTLQGSSSISLEVERGGKNISLKYNIR